MARRTKREEEIYAAGVTKGRHDAWMEAYHAGKRKGADDARAEILRALGVFDAIEKSPQKTTEQ